MINFRQLFLLYKLRNLERAVEYEHQRLTDTRSNISFLECRIRETKRKLSRSTLSSI